MAHTDNGAPITAEDVIYDWNTQDDVGRPPHRVEFDDETLRDGLQCPSVTNPSLDQKIQLLHLMADLGLDSPDVGLPGADVGHRQGREPLGGGRLPLEQAQALDEGLDGRRDVGEGQAQACAATRRLEHPRTRAPREPLVQRIDPAGACGRQGVQALALDEARAAANAGEAPIGAVLVDGQGEILAAARHASPIDRARA